VGKHIDFYPEIPSGPQFKFSQSQKWLKELEMEHRAQMCDVDGKHFYIFEPVELASHQIVVPIFFYLLDSQLHSKCIPTIFRQYHVNNKRIIKIKIPQDIQFDDPNLMIVHTNQFKRPYSEITLHGIYLSEECGDSLYGILVLLFFLNLFVSKIKY
jgi:hypothetical protein